MQYAQEKSLELSQAIIIIFLRCMHEDLKGWANKLLIDYGLVTRNFKPAENRAQLLAKTFKNKNNRSLFARYRFRLMKKIFLFKRKRLTSILRKILTLQILFCSRITQNLWNESGDLQMRNNYSKNLPLEFCHLNLKCFFQINYDLEKINERTQSNQ